MSLLHRLHSRRGPRVTPPPGGGGVGGAVAGPNEPAGMTMVVAADFTTLPPVFPTTDPTGFGVNSGPNPRLSIVTEGADTFLRGNVPFDHSQIGNSMWWFLSSDTPFILNTGQWYYRSRWRLSANHRMDCAFNLKLFSPRIAATGDNNFFMFGRGNSPAIGEKRALGEAQDNFIFWATQVPTPVGSVDRKKINLAPIFPGTWMDMEVLFLPGTAGTADSIMRVWINDILQVEYTDITPNNVGDGFSLEQLSHFFNYSALSPNPGIINSTDATGNPLTGWQDQQVDYDFTYASVEAV